MDAQELNERLESLIDEQKIFFIDFFEFDDQEGMEIGIKQVSDEDDHYDGITVSVDVEGTIHVCEIDSDYYGKYESLRGEYEDFDSFVEDLEDFIKVNACSF